MRAALAEFGELIFGAGRVGVNQGGAASSVTSKPSRPCSEMARQEIARVQDADDVVGVALPEREARVRQLMAWAMISRGAADRCRAT